MLPIIRFTETVPECCNRRRGRAAICNNLHMIFPYDFQILFKYVQMIVREVPYVFQYTCINTRVIQISKGVIVVYDVLLLSFPRCARLTSSTMRHNEKSKSVETQRFRDVFQHVPNKVARYCKQVTTVYIVLHPMISPCIPHINQVISTCSIESFPKSCCGIVGSV